MTSKKDLLFVIITAVITALFLPPTLKNFGLYDKLPNPQLLIYVGFPLISLVGMYIVSLIGKKVPILWQVAKFGQVGVMNTAIDFGILNFLVSRTLIESGVGIILLNIVSFSVATSNSYVFNKNWVFSAKKNASSSFLQFVGVSAIGIGINTGTVYVLTTVIGPLVGTPTQWVNIAKVGATGLSLVWNFLGYKLIVFKK